jgi:RNA polymerase sigma factor (sigma-70 family)
MDDWHLIREYAVNGSDSAFRSLVTLHLNHVHATALRLVRDSQLAEDVSQAVFILLARKAASLPSRIVLAGWLYRTTRFVAARALRAEQRRKHREEEAVHMQELQSPDQQWESLAPLLDEALDQLRSVERDALILRFFQDKPLEAVGRELGVTDEAARKRVARGLEKLRGFMTRRGFTISSTVLAATLGSRMANAAPTALNGVVASTAIAHAAQGSAALPFLASDVIKAWRRGRIKLVCSWGGVVIVVGLLLLGMSNGKQPRSATATPGIGGSQPFIAQAAVGASSSSESASTETAPARFAFRAVDAQTGEGIAGARVLAVVGQDQDHIDLRTNLTTDAQGRCDVPLIYPKVMLLSVGALADGYEERCVAAGGREPIPAGYELKLPRGSRIGGIVQDETGHPLAGAEICVQFYGTGDAEWREFQRERPGFPADDLVVAKTDESGRWTFGSAPAKSGAFWIEVRHPDFAKASFRNDGDETSGEGDSRLALADLQATKAILVLKRGLIMQGQVFDQSNRPVGGAQVSLSIVANVAVSTAQTGPDGVFELKNLPSGPGHVTVSLEGFAPERLPVRVGATNAPLLVQLKPGGLLKARVLDEAGAPVEHARVQLQGWRGPNTLDWGGFTDAEGRIAWASAPTDQLELVAFKEGFFFARNIILVADGQEHAITLHPQVSVSGMVTDAATQKPLQTFKVIPGSGPDRWQRNDSIQGTNGQYQLTLQEYGLLLVRFEADGYEPAVSEPLNSGSTQITYNVAMMRPNTNSSVHGVVLLPDASPAVGAHVALCTAEKGVTLGKKRFLDRGDSIVVTADSDGHFLFPAELNAHAVVAVHEQGFVQTHLGPTNHTLSLKLEPWGRIEGHLKLRHRNNAGQEITFYSLPMGPFPRGGLNLDLGAFSTKTDRSGDFIFEQVPPGDFFLAIILGLGVPFSYQTPVEIRPGQSMQVRIGGAGRAVKGQLVLSASNRSVDWSRQTRFVSLAIKIPRPVIPQGLSLEQLQKWQTEYWQSEEVVQRTRKMRSFAPQIQPDGSFTIEDVPPGTYELSGQLADAPFDPSDPLTLRATTLADIRQDVTVPEDAAGDSSDSLDLGTINLTPR